MSQQAPRSSCPARSSCGIAAACRRPRIAAAFCRGVKPRVTRQQAAAIPERQQAAALRYDAQMTGKLVIVGTPLGNLSDMTPRAIDALKSANVILCEDTRHTRKLLTHFGIDVPAERFDEH